CSAAESALFGNQKFKLGPNQQEVFFYFVFICSAMKILKKWRTSPDIHLELRRNIPRSCTGGPERRIQSEFSILNVGFIFRLFLVYGQIITRISVLCDLTSVLYIQNFVPSLQSRKPQGKRIETDSYT
ncbi:hypothetical protein Anas_14682, partial [Armadillidium nasatum]